MKELLRIVVATAILWALCAAAVELGNDRETVIPAPDAVAEGFTREVLSRRWDRARPYLQEPESMSDGDLRALEQRIRSRVRQVYEVEAKTIARDDDHARASVSIASSFGSDTIAYELVFDREWRIVTPRTALLTANEGR